MLFGFFVVCSIALAIATLLLIGVGGRLRHASLPVGVVGVVLVTLAAGEIVTYVWAISSVPVEAAEVFLVCLGIAVTVIRPHWNPVGQAFFTAFLGASLAYLTFAVDITVAGHLSILGSLASLVLLVLEAAALTLASSFAFETCDVLCRVAHDRSFPAFDPAYRPKVSLHIAAYNEPPDMLIETIRSAEALDYPDFEIVVVDNNTKEEEVWRPVEEYCAGRRNVRFVHVDPWPGFKSGALNLALQGYCDPDAEIVGVIDADYLVDPDYLRNTVGYFSDPSVAFVQTPQDYRDFEGSPYFTACYDAYRYFFATAMPSRNERNSIIFAGTMGLLRRPLLEHIGGWDEWCITEDAETSLRLLMAGYQGMYVAESFGRGVMPLTFSSLKSQRFRWCFGGMQILRRHWRSLMPWDRTPGNHLGVGQRLDYLFGGLQWLNDLVYLGFTAVLLAIAALMLAGQPVAIRPLVGPTAMLPAALLVSGLLRAMWALRKRTGISTGRALLAFCNWLSLSWTVARACLQGLVRSEGVFLRTPKTGGAHRLRAALRAAAPETALGIVLWGCAVAVALSAHAGALLVGLIAWQGIVYWSSPLMSWLAQRAHLTPELERRQSTEALRERLVTVLKPAAVVSSAVLAVGGVAAAAVLVLGASHAGHPSNPFTVPPRQATDRGPWGGVLTPVRPATAPGAGTSTTAPALPTTTTTPGTTTPGASSTTTGPAATSTTAGPTTTASTATTTSTTSTTTSTTTTTTAAG